MSVTSLKALQMSTFLNLIPITHPIPTTKVTVEGAVFFLSRPQWRWRSLGRGWISHGTTPRRWAVDTTCCCGGGTVECQSTADDLAEDWRWPGDQNWKRCWQFWDGFFLEGSVIKIVSNSSLSLLNVVVHTSALLLLIGCTVLYMEWGVLVLNPLAHVTSDTWEMFVPETFSTKWTESL